MTDLGSSAGRAEFYDEVAKEATGQPATTFTADAVYEATTRLLEVLADQLVAASHIRDPRPKRKPPRKL